MRHNKNDSEDLENEIIPEEIVSKVEDFENKTKSNLEETKTVNLGALETVKETHVVSIFHQPIDRSTSST